MAVGDTRFDFRAQAQPVRIYSGTNALEHLPREVARNRIGRALVVSGRRWRARQA